MTPLWSGPKPPLAQRVRSRAWREILSRVLPVKRGVDLVRIGTRYGGWIVPKAVLFQGAICYSAGLGEDGSFDLGLAEDYGCSVHVFDPTPRAIAYAEAAFANAPRIRFQAIGVWSTNDVLRFYAPSNPAHVSHSVVNLQRTERYFEAPCESVAWIMRRMGHPRIAVLKLDIEGAEFAVLQSVLSDRVPIDSICVEFDQPAAIRSILRQLWNLRRAGYDLVAIEGWNFTFQVNRQTRRTTVRR